MTKAIAAPARAVIGAAFCGCVLLHTAEAVAGKGSACPAGAITRKEAAALATVPRVQITDILLMSEAMHIGPKVSKSPMPTFRILRRKARALEVKPGESDERLMKLAEFCEALAMHRWIEARQTGHRYGQALGEGRRAAARKLHKARRREMDDARRWADRALNGFATLGTRRPPAGTARLDRVLAGSVHLEAMVAQYYRHRAKTANPKQAQAMDTKRRNHETRMLRYLRRLVMNHPRSRYVPLAMAVMGDHYVNKKQPAPALQFYQRVTRYGAASQLLRYAHLAAGRCYMASGRHTMALQEYHRAVRAAAAPAQSDLLNSAAQHRLVEAYARVGSPAKALPFFARNAASQSHMARSMFLLLGAVYLSTNQHRGARYVFATALVRWPKDPAACRWRKTLKRLGSRRP